MPEYPDWTRAFAMLGKFGAEWKVVALTEDGSMYALLQGETIDEEIRTVRLDDEGRMSAFVIDSVDAWTRMLTIGNAELAVRMGSPNIYDRRGQTLFMETFEQGLFHWEEVTSGAGAAVTISPIAALASGYSVLLTGGSNADWEAGVERIVPSRPVGRMGLEFSLAMPGSWDYVQVSFYAYTGTQVLIGVVRWHKTGYILQVLDEDAGYTNVGVGKVLGSGAKIYNTMKFVINTDDLGYERLMFNNQEIDISAYEISNDDDVLTSPHVKAVISLFSRNGFNDTMHLDNVIVTVAEPE
jgi:hypothetical protein